MALALLSMLLLAPACGADEAAAPARGVRQEAFPWPGHALERDRRPVANGPATIEAAFVRDSFRPGTTARLRLFDRSGAVTVQLFRVGPERGRTRSDSILRGVPTSVPRRMRGGAPGRTLALRIGDWPSGLYFARLTTQGGRVGFAPFVVRPRRLGEHSVAVVLPTFTWQAYNLRDDDRDGSGDTWYADWRHDTVRLARPFLNGGVPYNFRRYDLPFLRWLSRSGREADVFTDSDLDAVAGGGALASAYRLIVLPGHHEYVTAREFDALEEYRDLGGNLAFLSANNLFWQVVRKGDVLTRASLWRDAGRAESALVGVQYRANDRGTRKAPWIVRNVAAATWLFAGTPLQDGSPFGRGGIEIDAVAARSPRGVDVLAEIPDLFGSGYTAQMTFYETRSQARVFAAGAFNLFRTVETEPVLDRLLTNLWDELSTG